jgi:hypothetical protein
VEANYTGRWHNRQWVRPHCHTHGSCETRACPNKSFPSFLMAAAWRACHRSCRERPCVRTQRNAGLRLARSGLRSSDAHARGSAGLVVRGVRTSSRRPTRLKRCQVSALAGCCRFPTSATNSFRKRRSTKQRPPPGHVPDVSRRPGGDIGDLARTASGRRFRVRVVDRPPERGPVPIHPDIAGRSGRSRHRRSEGYRWAALGSSPKS